MRLLLLEDDAATRGYLDRVLAAAGHVVDSCASGPDAIFLGSSNDYAVLILDRMVPGVDGLGVLKALRAAGVADAGAVPDRDGRCRRPGRGA